MAGNRRRAAAVAVALLALAALVLQLADLRRFAVDDSFIFFRYADNLAAGRGFVFNAGEPAGEGFTSWAWLLLLALARVLGAEPLTAARLLGVLAHLATALLVYRLGVRVAGGDAAGRRASQVAAAALLLHYRLLAHSVSGMETALYTLAVTWLALLTARALQTGSDARRRDWPAVAAAALLAFMVRPEGIAAGGLSLLALALRRRRELARVRTWLAVGAALALPAALFLLWKIGHFGYLMPHSFYHKRIVRSVEYLDSLRQLGLFLLSYGALLLAAAAALARRPARRLAAYLLVLFAAMVAVYIFFYPAMNYLHRFYIPYLPLLLAAAAAPLAALFAAVARLRPAVGRAVAAALLAVLFVVGLNWDAAAAQAVTKSWARMVDPAVWRGRLGRLLAELPPQLVVANTEMGVVPYYSRLACIDMAGLTDPHIAHHGLTMAYLQRRGVGLILFPEEVARLTPQQWAAYTLNYGAVFQSGEFRRDFVLVGAFRAWPGGTRKYFLYADRRSPHLPAIRSWCRRHAAELDGE